MSHELRLVNYLLNGYDPSVRPMKDPGKPLQVKLGMALGRIERLVGHIVVSRKTRLVIAFVIFFAMRLYP